MICPKCDGDLDSFIVSKWGDGVHTQSIAPFVCSWCASLLMIDMQRNQLLTMEEIQRRTGLDVEGVMRQNKLLWDTITAECDPRRSQPASGAAMRCRRG